MGVCKKFYKNGEVGKKGGFSLKADKAILLLLAKLELIKKFNLILSLSFPDYYSVMWLSEQC